MKWRQDLFLLLHMWLMPREWHDLHLGCASLSLSHKCPCLWHLYLLVSSRLSNTSTFHCFSWCVFLLQLYSVILLKVSSSTWFPQYYFPLSSTRGKKLKEGWGGGQGCMFRDKSTNTEHMNAYEKTSVGQCSHFSSRLYQHFQTSISLSCGFINAKFEQAVNHGDL